MIQKSGKETVHLTKPVFIFLPIPKCASTSIIRSLGIRQNVPAVVRDRSLWWRQGSYKRLGWDTFPEFEKIYSFAIVRNPWDRVVSAWKNKNRYNYTTLSGYLRHTFLSLAKLKTLDNQAFAVQVQYEWHNMPQLDYISYEGRIVVNDIFRFENLEMHWGEIQKKTGINAPLLHVNRSAREEYRHYYDEETYCLVADRYAKDIETFGYTFG